LALELIRSDRPTDTPILWLGRRDVESLYPLLPDLGRGITHRDWARPPRRGEGAPLLAGVTSRQLRLLSRLGLARGLMTTVAAQRLRFGAQMLGRSDVVVTDRLHGHILSLLLGKPHVVLDNSYGKVRSFFETWTSAASVAHWASSADDAAATARRLYSEVSASG
jgi:pyruvyl transferase EpsO